MALFQCPVCGLPLTDDEARSPRCAICGGALAAPAAATTPPASPTQPPRAGVRRRISRWLLGVSALAALAGMALGVWRWQNEARERDTVETAAPVAGPVAQNDRPVERIATPPAPKTAGDEQRASVAYPPDAASAKAPGDATTDGDVGARAKPLPEPERVEPQPPKVADVRPVRPAPDPQMFQPQMPAFPNPQFQGNLGMPRIADNEIDQLFKMAFAQQQELEKLFNMAGMQDLDLLGAARAIQGLGKMQGFGARRPLGGAFGGAPVAEPRELILTGNGISNRDLESLRSQTTLAVLSLAGTAVTDAGMEHLKGLKGLRRLNLSGTRVTDKGLEALHGLTGLRELDLSNTQVTDTGSKRLQQALPDVEITR